MTARLDPVAAAPSLMKEWHRTSLALTSGLDPNLTELVKIRASQINGCANCINIHTVVARDIEESEQRTWRKEKTGKFIRGSAGIERMIICTLNLIMNGTTVDER